MDTPKNLVEGLISEMNRVRELIDEYKKIPTGQLGAGLLSITLKKAEAAMISGEVTEMLKAYAALKDWDFGSSEPIEVMTKALEYLDRINKLNNN